MVNTTINFTDVSKYISDTPIGVQSLDASYVIKSFCSKFDHLIAVLVLIILIYFLLKTHINDFALEGLKGSFILEFIPLASIEAFINMFMRILTNFSQLCAIYLVYMFYIQDAYNIFNKVVLWFFVGLTALVIISLVVFWVREQIKKWLK